MLEQQPNVDQLLQEHRRRAASRPVLPTAQHDVMVRQNALSGAAARRDSPMATCSSPPIPDKNVSGDNWYAQDLCREDMIDYFWYTYGFTGNKAYWENGWGWHDPCNTDLPLARNLQCLLRPDCTRRRIIKTIHGRRRKTSSSGAGGSSARVSMICVPSVATAVPMPAKAAEPWNSIFRSSTTCPYRRVVGTVPRGSPRRWQAAQREFSRRLHLRRGNERRRFQLGLSGSLDLRCGVRCHGTGSRAPARRRL